jgi:TBC1 domain family member 6
MVLVSDVDEYGFKRSQQEMEFLEKNNQFYANLTRREIEFKNLENSVIRTNFLTKSIMLKRYIRKGIPYSLRKQIWLKISKCQGLISKYPNLFIEALNTVAERDVTESIKIDIPRTFPDNIYFDKYKLSLYNVLRSYAAHNPVVR